MDKYQIQLQDIFIYHSITNVGLDMMRDENNILFFHVIIKTVRNLTGVASDTLEMSQLISNQ